MLLITDVLLVAMGVFFGAGAVAAVAGETPIDFMRAAPWRSTGLMAVGGGVSGLLWTVVFHPALLAVAGGFIGATFMTTLAGVNPKGFMDDPHPSRMAVYAGVAGGLTMLAWLAI